jgi:hypothetical protein
VHQRPTLAEHRTRGARAAGGARAQSLDPAERDELSNACGLARLLMPCYRGCAERGLGDFTKRDLGYLIAPRT